MSDKPSIDRVPSFIAGMMLRYEGKLRDECKRGRRYGPHYMNGHRFRRNKFRKSIRNWNYWSGRHQRLRNGIRAVTGFDWEMPKDCNSF